MNDMMPEGDNTGEEAGFSDDEKLVIDMMAGFLNPETENDLITALFDEQYLYDNPEFQSGLAMLLREYSRLPNQFMREDKLSEAVNKICCAALREIEQFCREEVDRAVSEPEIPGFDGTLQNLAELKIR